MRSVVQRQHMDNHLASMAGSAAADVRSVKSVAASVHAEVVTGEQLPVDLACRFLLTAHCLGTPELSSMARRLVL